MADALYFVQGERRKVFASVYPQTAGDTVQLTAPTVELRQNGVLVTGYSSPVPVTSFDPGPLPLARAWYALDTTALTPGLYVLTFTLDPLGSDGVTDIVEVEQIIVVSAPGSG